MASFRRGRLWGGVWCVWVLWSIAGGALAQQPAAHPEPPATSTAIAPSPQDAAPVTPEPASREPASPEPASRESAHLAEARDAVAQGETLFAAGNYEAALADFERAFELMGDDPRRHALLNNIAVCHERAFRYDLALAYYHRYLTEGPLDAVQRAEVRAVISTLERLLGTVEISVAATPELWVDGRHLGPCTPSLRLPAGRHVIELRAAGFEPKKREVTVVAGDTVRIAVTLTPIAELSGLPPAYFYVGAGLTAAAGITAAVLGASLAGERDRAEAFAAARAGRRTPETLAREQKLQDLQLGTDLAIITTAVLATGSVVLLVLTRWSGDQDDPPAGPVEHTRVAPWMTRDGVGLGMHGGLP